MDEKILEKAVITVQEERSQGSGKTRNPLGAVKGLPADAVSGLTKAASISLGSSSLFKKAGALKDEALQSVAGNPATGSALGKISESFQSPQTWRKFEVQFNPALLTFSTVASENLDKKNLSATEENPKSVSTISKAKKPLKANFSFSLVFFGDSASDNANALIAAIRGPNTRKIGFTWGNIHVEGNYESINADFTMFDSGGSPMRANVDIVISCQMDKSSVSAYRNKLSAAIQNTSGDNLNKLAGGGI